eukprot:gene36522-44304_t
MTLLMRICHRRACYVAFLLLVLFIHSSGEWVKIGLPSPASSFTYVAATWPAEGTVLACGQSGFGIILRSTNYGISWSQVFSTASGSGAVLRGLTSRNVTANGVTYYMAVDGNRFAYVSNGTGQIWVQAGSRATSGLFSAAIGSNGFAFNVGAGNIIRRSSYTASFSSWTTQSTDAAGAFWFDVSTVDGENVIVVGADGTIYYSSSSGATWIAGESGTTNDIYCVNHASSSSTFAMAAGALGYLAKTENGGSTWTTMTAFSSNYTARFRSISLLSTSEAYVAAYSETEASVGVIYRTLDGGIAWELIATVSDQVFSLSMLSSMYGVSGAATGIFTLVS